MKSFQIKIHDDYLELIYTETHDSSEQGRFWEIEVNGRFANHEDMLTFLEDRFGANQELDLTEAFNACD